MPPIRKKPPITLGDGYQGVSLQERNGVWHVRWRDPLDGSPKSRKAGVTAAECQAAADEALRQLNGGRSLRHPKAKVCDVIQDWINRELAPNKSYKTLTTYKPYCETYLECIADKSIGSVTPVTLEIILERLEEGGYSSAVRGKVKSVMVSLFRWAKKQGYIVRNPAADLPTIKTVHVKNIDDAMLNMREMLLVSSVADPYYRVHIKTLALTAMRIGELAGVRRLDCRFHSADEPPYIDIIQSFDRHAMKSPKNNKTRFVYVPQELADEIEQHIATQDETGIGVNPDALVFSTKGGTVLHDSNFRIREFRAAYERAVTAGLVKRKVSKKTDDTKGKPVMPFPHILRHGTATTLREHGVTEHNASSHLGHSSTAATKGYIHETDEGRLKATRALEEVLVEIDAEAAASAANTAPQSV